MEPLRSLVVGILRGYYRVVGGSVPPKGPLEWSLMALDSGYLGYISQGSWGV